MDRWPEFFLVGAMKAGSTTLHNCLNKHPDIFMSQPKEPGFFSRDSRFSRGPDWYRDHFKNAMSHQICGDSSTCYSRRPIYPNTANRIWKVKPDARILYVVRDPVLRAYSHYKHRMDEAIISDNPTVTYKEFLSKDEEVLTTGRYYDQIKPYYDLFGAHNVHICTVDDLVKRPSETLSKIYLFLQVPPIEQSGDNLPHMNQSGSKITRFHTTQIVNKFRRMPIVKQSIDLMPSNIKKSGALRLKSILMRSKVLTKIASKEHDELSRPDIDDLTFLSRYYKDDLQKLSHLTGIDIAHWHSFH